MEQDDRRVVAILGVFCLSYSVSYLFGLERIAEHAGSLPEWFSGRYNPSLASSLRVVQIIGNSLFFLLILSYGRRREPLFIKAWLVGACLSAFYSWYLIGCTLTGREPIMLPGMEGGLSDSLIIGVLGRTVPRSGTFLEGNFAGPFMLLSALLALSLHSMHKRWYTLWAAWFLWATVFLTFSTIPIICALAVPVVVIAMRLREAKPIEKRMLLGYVAVVTLAFGCTQVFSIPIIKEVVAYKVFGSPDDNTAIALSMADRKDFAQAGLKIAREFPTLGVGPSNYGLYFEKYSQVRGLGFGKKLIANNVYVELLAESGVLGFIAFFGFTYVVVRRYLWRAKWGKVQRLTALGFASLLLMFNAFPTFAVAYVWVYLAFVYLSESRLKTPGVSPGMKASPADGWAGAARSGF